MDSEESRQTRLANLHMYMLRLAGMKDTRLIALIEASQMKALKAAAKRDKVSLAEVVRRAISEYLGRNAGRRSRVTVSSGEISTD